MSNRTILIEHEGTNYSGILGTIKSTALGREDHGIMTAYLHVAWPSGGIGVGGYGLDEPLKVDGKFVRRQGTAYGLDFIMRVLGVLGVESWEKIPGTQVIVLFPEGTSFLGQTASGIASTTSDKVFILRDHADSWKD